MKEGVVFDISHYMLEDGPGIRTNVFVKGCFLRCKWCSNVYGLEREEELSYDRGRCTGCGACVKVCPKQAIAINNPGEKTLTNFEKCKDKTGVRSCNFECVSVCPSKARKKIGFKYTVDEVYREIEKDRMFYRRSEGGVTMSGGEILMQPEFVKGILEKCSINGINTAIETSGFGKWEDLSEIIKFTDTVFMDLKCMNPERHKNLTGVDNKIILENIKKAKTQCMKQGSKFIIRLPLIPGLNDDTENLKNTAEFVKSLSGEDGDSPLLNILPYHNYGESKYEFLGKDYELKETEPPSKTELEEIAEILDKTGVKFTIGGYDI